MTLEMVTADLITKYLAEAKRRYAANTVQTRGPVLKRVAAAHNGDLLHLTGDDIDRWLDIAEIQPTTRNVYVAALRSFYRWCMKRGHLDHNPALDATRMQVPRGLPRPVRGDDLAVAIGAADPKMRAWLCLMAYTGLRCCEVAAVHVEDLLFHLDPPMVHVCHGTKGGHQRIVPLAELTEQALIGFGLPRAGVIFRRPGSIEPITAGQVSRKVNQFLDELDIQATAHQLRHWFGTTFYQQTLDLRATQEYMGHAHAGTTSIYTQFARTESARVVRNLGST